MPVAVFHPCRRPRIDQVAPRRFTRASGFRVRGVDVEGDPVEVVINTAAGFDDASWTARRRGMVEVLAVSRR